MEKSSKKWIFWKYLFLVISILTFLFILYHSVIPGSISAKWSDWAADFWRTLLSKLGFKTGGSEEEASKFYWFVRKFIGGHALLFMIYGFFFSLYIYFLNKDRYIEFSIQMGISFGLGIITAGISEILQLFAPDRYGTLLDVGIDLIGYTIGLLIASLIALIVLKKNKRKV